MHRHVLTLTTTCTETLPEQALLACASSYHSEEITHQFSQVEEVRNPALKSNPLGVTQKYLIVTSNYEARSRGVTKLMGIKDAQAVCPEINLVRCSAESLARRHTTDLHATTHSC